MKVLKLISPALGAVMLLGAAATADAATLTLMGGVVNDKGTKTYDPLIERAQLTCSLGCEGLLSNQGTVVVGNQDNVPDPSTRAGFSNELADLFDLGNSGDDEELAFVNLVADPDFASGTKIDTGGASILQFVSSAEFILLKIGTDPNYALIRNLFAGSVFNFSAFEGQGAGASHYVEFGLAPNPGVGEVPLPAALPLLLSAFGGLGFIGWRRRRPVSAA